MDPTYKLNGESLNTISFFEVLFFNISTILALLSVSHN